MSAKRSIKYIVLPLFGFLILLTIGSYIILLLEERNASEQQVWVIHTYSVIEESGKYLSHMINAETGQRGFLLTHQQAYLDPYSSGVKLAQSSFDRLRMLTMDNPSQQRRLDAIEKLMQNKLDELSQTISLVQQGRNEDALEMVKSDHGKVYMDGIRSTLEEFVTEEQGLLALRETEFRENNDSLRQLFVFEVLVLISIIFVIALLVQNRLVKPIIKLTDDAKRISDSVNGNADLHDVDTSDEMSRLLITFEHMHQKINQRSTELEEAKHKLESQNVRLVDAVNLAQEATSAKSDFLARMSHEIRTPMNAIVGLSHLALQTNMTPKQQDYLNKISSSAQSLLHIINDILDFSKIEAGKLELNLAEFELDDVLNSVSNLIAIKAAEKNLELVFQVKSDVPIRLVGDRIRLEEVLLNLTGNAVKFTERGEVVVAVRPLNAESVEVKLGFTISDTGPGITDATLSKLFKPFSQANENVTREHGGTGLGLVICKRLIEMMGGEIQVKSKIGHGSKFFFTAVFGLTADSTMYHKALSSPYLSGLRVLAIDDSDAVRKALRHMLESFSFEVSVVESGEHGIDAAEASIDDPYALILIDQCMPDGIDGIEALSRIRQLPGYEEVPAILLTPPYGGEREFERAEQAGFVRFAYKPLGPTALFDAVMEAMGHKSPNQVTAKYKQVIDSEKLDRICGTKVLLVEDNDINQQVAIELLERLGCVVEVASNGLEALEQVQKENFEIVFMDVQMPRMDGLEATRQIRRIVSESGLRDLSNIPIIAMTAHALVGDYEKSIAAGMNDHLTKPLDPGLILEALDKWVRPKDSPEKTGALMSAYMPDASVQAPLPELVGIDVEKAVERMGGNVDLYNRLLRQFRHTNGRIAIELQDAFDQNDLDQVKKLAHAIKGVSANLGMDSLSEISTRIESLEGTEIIDEGQLLLDKFELHLNRAFNGIDQHEQEAREPEIASVDEDATAIDKQRLSKLLKELELSLDTDLVATSRHAQDLRLMLMHSEYDELLQRLDEQLDSYDSDSARETICAIEQITECGGVS